VTNISVSYKDVRIKRGRRIILSVDDLRIRRGEFVGVVGTNGAGKSTLLKVGCGLIRPQSGSVFLAGVNRQAKPDKVRLRGNRRIYAGNRGF